MKRKLVNKIILTLSFILLITTSYTIRKYIKVKYQPKIIQVEIAEDKTNLISKEILIKKLNNENKLLVLSGESEIKATYSNKDISDDDVNFKWIKDWFSEMNSKDLSINATYKYQFHYDLTDLDLEVVGDSVNINLSKNRLNCQVELVENKSLYTDRVGLIESKFTAQEINSLNGRTKDLVLNRIQSDKELREKAIENLQKNIEELLGVKCNFSVTNYDVIEYNDSFINKIN